MGTQRRPIVFCGHYMTKSMWTPAHRTSHSKIMGINIDLVPPFAAITASTLLARLSTRCWNIAAGTCFHSTTRALVRLGTDVGRLGLARSWRSNSSQMFDGVEVRALCRPVKFFHSNLMPFLYAPRFVLKQERAFRNCCHKVGSTEPSRMSLYAYFISLHWI
jgi:hypothetical protein